MKTTLIKEDWDVLTSFLPAGWEDKAQEKGAFLRRRKVDSPETLLRLLLIHLADGKSLRTTAAYASEAGLCHINDVALLHRLRCSGEWLRWMALGLLGDINIGAAVQKLFIDSRVLLIDASMVSEPGSTGSDWRLHYSMNLNGLHCNTFKITDYRQGESFTHFEISPDDILVGDRIYCNQKGILHVVGQGADVLVRFHSTALPLYDYRGKRITVLDKLQSLERGKTGDWNAYLLTDSGDRVKVRICAIKKSVKAFEREKKAILKAASKKQRKVKPETLEYAKYITVVTTLNRHRLKKADVLALYRARWQVELSFKRLKSILGLGHLPKTDPDSCRAWLYGKMLVALLVERIRGAAESFSPWGYPIGSPEEDG